MRSSNAFDREQAHRKSKDLSHLKDDVDEKNSELIERARQQEDDANSPDAESDDGQQERSQE
ncbi:hypothetical protein ACFVSN_01000 [Kitasatospora sp. NPDC057904]|uniref:hypothetical protein n=1 Tax=unclassified Kitasatospora TaxID=2633591 RepID=UPI0036DE0DD3